MIKSAVAASSRFLIGAVHAFVVTAAVLVASTGVLTVPAFLLWAAMCAAVDQAFVWTIWAAGGQSEPGPNKGWF